MSENKQYPSYKVVVLGESSVGKTSLVHRFTSNRFDTRTSNTIGAAFTTKVYSTPDKPDRKINLEIWDTAGQERYRSLYSNVLSECKDSVGLLRHEQCGIDVGDS